MKRFSTLIILTAFILLSTGCLLPLRGLKEDLVIKHPDSPMVIIEGEGRIKVAIYDPETNGLIEFGWVDLGSTYNQYHGWTLMKYDWQKFLIKKEND